MRVRLEFKPQDLWIGVYWKRAEGLCPFGWPQARLDIWICLVPMFPIHFMLGSEWVR